MLIYVITFVAFYFFLSLFGILWVSYMKVLQNLDWLVGYSMLIGWWIALLPAIEYYKKNEDYFIDIFP